MVEKENTENKFNNREVADITNYITEVLRTIHRVIPIDNQDGNHCMQPDKLKNLVATTYFSPNNPLNTQTYDLAMKELFNEEKVAIGLYPNVCRYSHPKTADFYDVIILK
jgi:hypothetical protein